MNIKRIIYLNAGHSDTDPGAQWNGLKESDLNKAVRDELVPELEKRGFKVVVVPDSIQTLAESIKWVNRRVSNINDGLAFSLHVNCCGGQGAECYYYRNNSTSKYLASQLINRYCREMGMPNRGAKSSSITRFGRLGWIEDTNCWSLLLEMGFISNKKDVLQIQNYRGTATAIANAIDDVYGQTNTMMNEPDLGPHPSVLQAQLIDLRERLKVILSILARLQR